MTYSGGARIVFGEEDLFERQRREKEDNREGERII
jgi:hypothetical protein